MPEPTAPIEPTDEQIAEAIEREFSETGEWPEGDVAIVRAFLKHSRHWRLIQARN